MMTRNSFSMSPRLDDIPFRYRIRCVLAPSTFWSVSSMFSSIRCAISPWEVTWGLRVWVLGCVFVRVIVCDCVRELKVEPRST
jgi:hypothetical protein